MENLDTKLETREKKLYYTLHKLDYITMKSLYGIKREKRNPTKQEKIFSTHVNGKDLYPEYIFKRRRNSKEGWRGERKTEKERKIKQ